MDNIVLFGAGQLGRRTAYCLCPRFNIIFADNHKAGQTIDGVRVISACDAIREYGDNTPFVVTIYNGAVVKQQLACEGVKVIRDVLDFYKEHADLLLPYACLEANEASHADHMAFASVYPLLADKTSRWLAACTFDFLNDLTVGGVAPHDNPSTIYFPNFIKPLDDEVFVDCGAYDGDTIQQFLTLRNNIYREVIAFEADPSNFKRLREWRRTIPDGFAKIFMAQLAVGATDEDVYFDFSGDQGSHKGGGTKVVQAAIDSLLCHRFGGSSMPTYIKMDIEGAELEALEGARRTIRENSPVLAICLYHQRDHLWRIPHAVHNINPSYKLFMRAYAATPWETVLYAVPEDRVMQ